MRRTLYITNFVLVVATVIGWLFGWAGAALEFLTGCFQLVCMIIYLVAWRTLSPRTKKHFRRYLQLLLAYGILLFLGAMLMEYGNDQFELTFNGTLGGIMVMGLAMLLAAYFVYVSFCFYKDKKEIFMEYDSDVLDRDFIDPI